MDKGDLKIIFWVFDLGRDVFIEIGILREGLSIIYFMKIFLIFLDSVDSFCFGLCVLVLDGSSY